MRSDIVPAHFIEKSFLAAVPISIYGSRQPGKKSGKAASDKRNKFKKLFGISDKPMAEERYRFNNSAQFNVGGWVALPYELRKPVSLCVVYVDREGEHAIIVEEMEARGASQVLLSGSVTINAKGPIQSIDIYCGGIDDDRVNVVDLHIQKIVSTGTEKLPLAS